MVKLVSKVKKKNNHNSNKFKQKMQFGGKKIKRFEKYLTDFNAAYILINEKMGSGIVETPSIAFSRDHCQ